MLLVHSKTLEQVAALTRTVFYWATYRLEGVTLWTIYFHDEVLQQPAGGEHRLHCCRRRRTEVRPWENPTQCKRNSVCAAQLLLPVVFSSLSRAAPNTLKHITQNPGLKITFSVWFVLNMIKYNKIKVMSEHITESRLTVLFTAYEDINVYEPMNNSTEKKIHKYLLLLFEAGVLRTK